MKRIFCVLSLLCACMLTSACSGKMPRKVHRHDIRVVMKTTKGDVVLNLYAHRVPMACVNFLVLAKDGFYNGLTFHRVVPGFVVQGGDPTGTGSGGPGYTFPDEIRVELKHDKPGVLALANAGKDTNGSQFFITQKAAPHLDGKHSVFGEIMRGQSVVEQIEPGDRMIKVTVIDDPSELFEKNQQFVDAIRKRLAEQKAAGKKPLH